MPTKVYKFGLLPPVVNADLVHRQMLEGHRYANDLVAIDRGRRDAIRLAMREHAPGLVELEDAAAKADEACANELDKSLRKPLVEARKAANAAVFAARKALKEDAAYQSRITEIEELALVLQKSLRAHSPAYWCTQGIHDRAMFASRSALKLFDGIEPCNPRFSRWTGDGEVAVQIQAQAGKPPFTSSKLFGADTRVRIDPVATWCKRNRHGEERRKLPLLHLRIDSDGERKPVFAAWPIVQHRGIPTDAVVKGVVVMLRHRGPRAEWWVNFTVEEPERDASCGRGTVAVHFGWRGVPGGLRVATTADSDGNQESLVLSERVVGGLKKVHDLASIRDQNFNAARAALVVRLDAMPELPTWLERDRKTMAQWRSSARLAQLTRRWAERRFAGDDDAFLELEAWRYHDHHLWAWEESQRVKSLRYRRDVYRAFAARLSGRYGTLAIDDFDLRGVIESGGVGQGNRQMVAVSELRETLVSAFKARGGVVVKVAAQHVTQTCHACGHIESFKAAAMIHHLCSKCSAVWDQDENAAKNTLARCERPSGEPTPVVARNDESANDPKNLDGSKPLSRWAKVKARAAEKRAARNPVAKSA